MANQNPANASAPAKASGSSDAPSVGDLATRAHDEVQQQIGDETSFYKSDISREQGGMQAGLAGIGKMFGDLMPYAQNAAKFVGDYYNASLAREQNIYEEAQGRLGMIRAQRAAEAQQMAQQTGGPVNVEAFLAPLNTSMVELPNAQQNTLFHSNMLAQGGVQEAEAWAGRVFPMIRVEQEQQLRASFQAKIDAYQREIDRINQSASSREKTRLEELQEKERLYKLDQARLALDRLKADREWRLSQQQLKNQTAGVANERANILGYYEGRYRGKDGKIHTWRKPTSATSQYNRSADQKDTEIAETHDARVASNMIDNKTLAQNKANADRTYAQNQKAFALQRQLAAATALQNLSTPGSKTQKTTKWSVIGGPGNMATYNALTADKKLDLYGVYWDAPTARAQTGNDKAKAGNYYLKGITVQEPDPTVAIKDPTAQMRALIGMGYSKEEAYKAVRSMNRLSSDWKMGQQYDPADKPSLKKIQEMDFNEARDEAMREGWTKDPKKKATAYTLKVWLMHHYGYPITDKQHPDESVPTKTTPKKKTTAKTGTIGQQIAANIHQYGWDPVHKYWITKSGKVVLRGHPPGSDGKPTGV